MNHLTMKMRRAKNGLSPLASECVRELFKGETDWGDEDEFIAICNAAQELTSEDAQELTRIMKDINLGNNWTICPDGRA